MDISDFTKTRFDASRLEKLRILELYYLRHLVEDPREGTAFDCDILDFFNAMRLKLLVTEQPK